MSRESLPEMQRQVTEQHHYPPSSLLPPDALPDYKLATLRLAFCAENRDSWLERLNALLHHIDQSIEGFSEAERAVAVDGTIFEGIKKDYIDRGYPQVAVHMDRLREDLRQRKVNKPTPPSLRTPPTSPGSSETRPTLAPDSLPDYTLAALRLAFCAETRDRWLERTYSLLLEAEKAIEGFEEANRGVAVDGTVFEGLKKDYTERGFPAVARDMDSLLAELKRRKVTIERRFSLHTPPSSPNPSGSRHSFHLLRRVDPTVGVLYYFEMGSCVYSQIPPVTSWDGSTWMDPLTQDLKPARWLQVDLKASFEYPLAAAAPETGLGRYAFAVEIPCNRDGHRRRAALFADVDRLASNLACAILDTCHSANQHVSRLVQSPAVSSTPSQHIDCGALETLSRSHSSTRLDSTRLGVTTRHRSWHHDGWAKKLKGIYLRYKARVQRFVHSYRTSRHLYSIHLLSKTLTLLVFSWQMNPSGTSNNASTFSDTPKGSRDSSLLSHLQVQSLQKLQRQMGLEHNPPLFDSITRAVHLAISKARRCSKVTCHRLDNQDEKAEIDMERVIWNVRDYVPFVQEYQDYWPIYDLVRLHLDTIREREALFKLNNASTATLPDYESEQLQVETYPFPANVGS
ncbi:hypothetical protein CC1G_15355 [Coprinopsis cinerea okayama7|uniref:Uncharacterized protein n=1 Tax=Coprinopsis cinerea (strain Okayama-7 / 130 / ATCC MYA-4618 / FGSC 9003) TaxID=240176 RepID=D6RQ34_COPC7|nr:hypothetical protein CC1G_15355 [Coprinopsis cinerea okayama7\|eukprot:XP_002910448.1 hypothetical protein CC1G_15355 [Coprinopsis cinerea okayama7\